MCIVDRWCIYIGALLYRLRWYKTLTCPDRIFLERKTHREGWGQEESIKERFSLPTHQLDAFMAGTFMPSEDSFLPSDKDIPAQIALAREVQEHILNDKHSLVPASRTAYERTAFQLSTSNDVR
jgi:SPX domain protein involved in polyphosphate accumulation